MRFSKPLVSIPAAIIVRDQVRRNLSMNDLKGLKIAVVSGYAAHDFLLAEYPHLNLEPVADVETALRKVAFGAVDAMIGNLACVTVNLRSGKIPITWHGVTRHFQNIEYRPG
ncbi:MAG: transporter substrate-binding domain-containing protein, partial [Candidatus Sedimenticola endophacoides]